MAGKTTTTKKTSTKRAVSAKTSATRKEAAVAPKQRKPIFGAGTWVTLVILAVLIGATIYLNRTKETAAAAVTPTGEPSPVFSAADGAPSSIEVKPAEGEAAKIARNADNAWAVVLPFETEANQGLAEAAATQVSALKVISSIDADPSIFGLDKPKYTITVEFAGGKKHTLEVGDSTPTNSGYYVRIDNDKMAITDLSGIDALLQLAAFPPYLNTPTPTALPATETPVPPTEAITTPDTSVTPTP